MMIFKHRGHGTAYKRGKRLYEWEYWPRVRGHGPTLSIKFHDFEILIHDFSCSIWRRVVVPGGYLGAEHVIWQRVRLSDIIKQKITTWSPQ